MILATETSPSTKALMRIPLPLCQACRCLAAPTRSSWETTIPSILSCCSTAADMQCCAPMRSLLIAACRCLLSLSRMLHHGPPGSLSRISAARSSTLVWRRSGPSAPCTRVAMSPVREIASACLRASFRVCPGGDDLRRRESSERPRPEDATSSWTPLILPGRHSSKIPKVIISWITANRFSNHHNITCPL